MQECHAQYGLATTEHRLEITVSAACVLSYVWSVATLPYCTVSKLGTYSLSLFPSVNCKLLSLFNYFIPLELGHPDADDFVHY